MNWLRLYHDLPHDPKLKRIAHLAGATLPHVISVWVSMLCHASKNEGDRRGTLDGWDDTEWAFDIGMDRAIVFSIREAMFGRLVDDGGRIIAWDRRQFQSDTSRARQQAYRERKQTEQKQAHNSDVTSPDRHVTVTSRRGDAPDTETETETEAEEEASPPARPRTRALEEPPALPEWLSSEAWSEWCTYRTAQSRKGWTQAAAQKCISTLARLRDEGHDPTDVIDQSIASGWTGLFAVKGSKPTAKPSKTAWALDDNNPLFRRSA